jgi:hypothetical protein
MTAPSTKPSQTSCASARSNSASQHGFESNRRKEELDVYKIQAAKSRALKNRLVTQEKELRIELAESKLASQRPAPSPAESNKEAATASL